MSDVTIFAPSPILTVTVTAVDPVVHVPLGLFDAVPGDASTGDDHAGRGR